VEPNDFKKRPVATVSVLSVTGILTVLQYVFPPLLPLLERTPSALVRHEWWRLFTPLFAHSDGLRQVAFNFPAILIVGILAERIFGHVRWIVIYFTCGLVGEVAAYAWHPTGAGASVAGAGLLGSLAFWLLHDGKVVQAQIGGGIILVGSLILVYFHDIHGPPILAGALIAFVMKTHKEKPSAGSIRSSV
jgi:membrane associated rhomboid family serine protease